jgi:hypothetical protein
MKTNFLIRKVFYSKLIFFLEIIFISSLIISQKAEGACTINSTQNGTLSLIDDYSISSQSSPGSLNISCTGETVITIDSITDVSSEHPIDRASVIVSDFSSQVVAADTQSKPPPQVSGLLPDPIINQIYTVELTLRNFSSLIPAGNYRYSVGIMLGPP